MLNIEINPTIERQREIIRRPTFDDAVITARVADILHAVARDGDAAIRRICLDIDGYCPDPMAVGQEEIAQARHKVSAAVKEAVKTAAENIKKFHRAQQFREIRVETAPGVVCVQRAVPIRRVGLYIPGGSAPLFSTVLMLALPAKIAGCKEVVMCTPADRQGRIAPEVLYAADVCGVDTLYKIGGAQAIGAMAYGTDTVRRVDKIFGPGNRYVAKAKANVSQQGTAIDMLAGPSEVLVVADETANPTFVASDLLSQAEHGPDSQVILASTSERIARQVQAETQRLLAMLPRREIARRALQESHIVVMPTVEQCIAFSNLYAPEHLILSVADPWAAADLVTAAGSVFVGHYSPESAGDYASGTNHTLPTSGTAAASSGVNLDSFMRKITYQQLSPEGLASLSPAIIAMAEAEGLDAHALAAKVRICDQ